MPNPVELRETRGRSVAYLARTTGINYQRLWRYYAYQGQLSTEELERVRAVLDEAGDAEHSTAPRLEAKAS